MRITTNGSMYKYRSGLASATYQRDATMQKVMSQRNFDSYAQDPAAATRAFRVHSSLNATNTQHENTSTVIGKNQVAWSNMETVIDDLTNTLGKVPAMSGLNDTNLDTLDIQGQVMFQGAEAIVSGMNSKYNDQYVFNGADTYEAPFSIEQDGDSHYVAFRGVSLSHNLDAEYIDPETGVGILNPNAVPAANYTNKEMLDVWNAETLYVDIGRGFELDANGQVIPATAYNAALSGVGILGYGVDADGNPENIADIMIDISEMFQSYDIETKTYGIGSREEVEVLFDKFGVAHDHLIEQHAKLSADTQSLEQNLSQLEDTYEALNFERSSIEDVDLVEAIQAYMWAENSYNAALQVGVNAIPESLMDYMK